MTTLFLFPRARFVDANGIAGQMLHIGSELMEFEVELRAGNYQAAMTELLDLRHSIETAFRILQEKYGVDQALVALSPYHGQGMSAADHLHELHTCYRVFGEAVLARSTVMITVKLQWLLQAVDTELVLLAPAVDESVDEFIALVTAKNTERGYYDAGS